MTRLHSEDELEEEDHGQPQVVDLGDEVDDTFSVLKSEISRKILIELYEEPCTSSDVADRVDTSLQNTNYHLDRLCEANLVKVVDTQYSAKRREMKIYAPSSSVLTFVLGRDESVQQCRQAIDRVDQE